MTPAGEQVLTIFQSEALVQVDEQDLKKTEAFILETRQMRDAIVSDEHEATGVQAAKGRLIHE